MTSGRSLLTELEMLSPLQAQLLLGLTFLALQSKDNLSCRLGLFVKDGLCLSTESHLLGIVTTFSLSKVRCLTSLVLCDLVVFVLLALTTAVRFPFFGYIHHVAAVLMLLVQDKEMEEKVVSTRERCYNRNGRLAARLLK
jgi:hypothetical protein